MELLRWYGRSVRVRLVAGLTFLILAFGAAALGTYIANIFGLSEDAKMYVMLGCLFAFMLGGGLAWERVQRWRLYD